MLHQVNKKVALFPEINRVEFFYHLPAPKVECKTEYIFFVKKNTHTHKKKAKQAKEEKRRAKETKEEKDVVVNSVCRTVSVT